METEILDIRYHVRLMVLKALNKYKTNKEAAEALGITDRMLRNYKFCFDIEKCPVTKGYHFKNEITSYVANQYRG